jgi:hypothetical protein
MLTLIRNGGFPMFFILAFGMVALLSSAWYAYRPNARSLAFAEWMGRTTLFATLLGLASDLGEVFSHVSRAIEQSAATWPRDLVEGCAESMSPPIMGFAFLAMTALLTSVGRARDPHV